MSACAGEISGFKRAASGHIYFSLKDENARLDAVMWKGGAARLPFAPEDGLEVVATGKLTTYAGRSNYQIVVEALEVAGEGAMMLLFEKLKARLAAEGLFAPERKKTLPSLPRIIGVVTSPTGAVIRDILHRLADRFPSHVIVWPVLVQGDGAAAQIARAVNGFSAMSRRHRDPIWSSSRAAAVPSKTFGRSMKRLWSARWQIAASRSSPPWAMKPIPPCATSPLISARPRRRLRPKLPCQCAASCCNGLDRLRCGCRARCGDISTAPPSGLRHNGA